MEPLLRLTEEEYLVIEEAVSANTRGRAFLRMRDKRARAFSAEETVRILKEYLGEVKISAPPPQPATVDSGAHVRILRQELQEMSVYIQQTRSEVAALRPNDTGNNRIMAASGELDAIVLATERATSDILNAAEQISAIVAKLPRDDENVKALARDIDAQAIEILTACSFQDITGQRINKVVATLHYLEKRVNSMIEIWGIDGNVAPMQPHPDEIDKRPDAHLLNGPSDDGVSQDDVDALLAGLAATSVSAPAPAPAPVAAPTPPAKAAAPAPAPVHAAPPPEPPKKQKEKAVSAAAPAPAPAPAPVPAPAPPAPPVAAKPAPPPPPPPKVEAPPPSNAQANQSDIDALFD